MQKQKDMENAMLVAHREFATQLEKAIQIAEKELTEAEHMESICTDEWCRSTEYYLDDLHKSVYSISEPRYAGEEDHRQIQQLRNRVKDLYFRFKSQKKAA